jgi:hypothetical protein
MSRNPRTLKEVKIDLTKTRSCSRCHKDKPGTEFRVINIKRTRYSLPDTYYYSFQNGVCLACEAKRNKEYQKTRNRTRRKVLNDDNWIF